MKKFSVYADLRWKNNINSAAVITLINTKILDRIVENISLFDIKTKTNLFDIYNVFDWKMIEYSAMLFEAKQDKFHKTQLKNINLILSPTPLMPHYFRQDLGEIEIDFGDKLKHQDNIHIKFNLKVGLCLKEFAKSINSSIFNRNFETIIKY